MKTILEKYLSQQTGLLLLNMPTGFGKTYNILEFIYEHYREFIAQKRKILFVTNLKKNLPYNELKERFIEDGKLDEFEQTVIFLDSNADYCLNNLLSVESEIPEEFKQEVYKKLIRNIRALQGKDKLPKEVRDILEQEIRKDESEFRKLIKQELNRKFRTKKERLKAIKTNNRYQWIGKVYPAVFSEEKTVFFLTMDKFLVKNAVIIEDSYYFHEDFVKNAIIFIDEFDASKEIVLKSIIESGLRHKLDLINLFLNIHRHLIQIQCPEILLQESEYRQKRSQGKNWQSLPSLFDSFRDKAEKIFKTYHLQYTCKSYDLQPKRNFLFYDYEFHNVLNRYQLVLIDTNDTERVNFIKTCDFKNKENGVEINKLLRDIAGFLTYFQRGVSYLAENYYHGKKEKCGSQDDFTFTLESSVTTVLSEFRLNSENIQFLTLKIMENDFPYGLRNKKQTLENQSFYTLGFRYHDIVDSEEHDTLSKVYLYSFDRTPESFLKDICSKAMVVGVSATATLKTNIGNYDLDYLKSCLGESFITLNKDDLVNLKNDYQEATQGYDQVIIKTQFMGSESAKEALEKLENMLDQYAAKDFYHKLKLEIEDQQFDFIFCRYVRILEVWKYFLDHPDCLGFICFLNKFPKKDDRELNLNYLYQFGEMLMTDEDKNIETIMIVLSSNDFEENKEWLLTDLSQKKRRFILSPYQTIGVGQNLQFKIPNDFSVIPINDRPQSSKMDINGIYLDKPTHLLVNTNRSMNENEFVKYIFQLEFLQENGAISRKTFKDLLENAFKAYIGEKTRKPNFNLYETSAYSFYVNKVIIQAIGRICRTNMKSSSIHILADDSLKKYLATFPLSSDMITVPEYGKLIEFAKQQSDNLGTLDQKIKTLEDKASNCSNWCNSYIQRQLNTQWTSQSVKDWKELREQVLRYPTLQESDNSPKWSKIYIELPQPNNCYYFTQENDYNNVQISFRQEGNNLQQVSEMKARLPELMKISLFQDEFKKQGYAIHFTSAEFMITPVIFNNIYKGALGEKCGELIFQEYLGRTLQELEIDKFEKFDFKINDQIYIDFKFWNDQNPPVDATLELEKIRQKMKDVKASRVFIINILGSSERKFSPILSDEDTIIQIPYLCKNDSIDPEAIQFLKQTLGELIP